MSKNGSATTNTATVETLTAQVRVLMVGSRQVTLSVAKQLDEVEPGQMEIFGRVRIGSFERFIGARKKDGTLVVSGVLIRPWWCYGNDDVPLIVLAGLR